MCLINLLQSIMWPEVLVYINFILLAYTPWTNIPTTLHIYVLLYFYCSPTKCKFNLPCYCHICTSNIYAPQMPLLSSAQIIWHAFMGEVCQCICHIWSCSHQWCSQNHCKQMTMMPVKPMMTVPTMMMTPQSNCICWVGHLAKSAKS